jgi:hypothetical protein
MGAYKNLDADFRAGVQFVARRVYRSSWGDGIAYGVYDLGADRFVADTSGDFWHSANLTAAETFAASLSS